MATNVGGARKGAVKNRFQMKNALTGLFTIFDSKKGTPLYSRKSTGPAKGISKQVPKKFR